MSFRRSTQTQPLARRTAVATLTATTSTDLLGLDPIPGRGDIDERLRR
ncbi:hypothetical protein [Thiocapsa sp.]|nr:hypothetical protein [Thiocapsa sp.]HSO82846.1 hypothetical protein [Thiocapsa sp.]